MKLKYFFIGFLASSLFFGGLNVLSGNIEDFLFWQEIANNPQIFTAQITQNLELEKLKPIRNRRIANLEIEATSAISVLIKFDDSSKILFEKEKDKILPIASLTKLMTANVAINHYDLSQKIKITKKAVETMEDFGNFKIGELFSVKELLYPLLMESSNDAATALIELIGEKAFIDLMNLEAKNLGLNNTYFVNPTGLELNNFKNSPSAQFNGLVHRTDLSNSRDAFNYSTAEDLVRLANYLLKKHPLIWEILSLKEFDFYTENGTFHHKIINTNELLKELPSLIVGGKTGEAPKAQGCLLLVIKAPKNKGYIVNVILGSKDRFGEMRKLINWLNLSYQW